ncbi:unnamed protein product [Prorocentrum cordatum]|uniref:Helicase ATP-binding domain-containing protein n=1 Tax=Prorocentrum cordatum TaxID=2364126 RepID=A0ABN9XWC1_9DINO|nr:unnamed protein product [Polarella glacialis]
MLRAPAAQVPPPPPGGPRGTAAGPPCPPRPRQGCHHRRAPGLARGCLAVPVLWPALRRARGSARHRLRRTAGPAVQVLEPAATSAVGLRPRRAEVLVDFDALLLWLASAGGEVRGLSYHALDRRATRVVRRLRAQGVDLHIFVSGAGGPEPEGPGGAARSWRWWLEQASAGRGRPGAAALALPLAAAQLEATLRRVGARVTHCEGSAAAHVAALAEREPSALAIFNDSGKIMQAGALEQVPLRLSLEQSGPREGAGIEELALLPPTRKQYWSVTEVIDHLSIDAPIGEQFSSQRAAGAAGEQGSASSIAALPAWLAGAREHGRRWCGAAPGDVRSAGALSELTLPLRRVAYLLVPPPGGRVMEYGAGASGDLCSKPVEAETDESLELDAILALAPLQREWLLERALAMAGRGEPGWLGSWARLARGRRRYPPGVAERAASRSPWGACPGAASAVVFLAERRAALGEPLGEAEVSALAWTAEFCVSERGGAASKRALLATLEAVLAEQGALPADLDGPAEFEFALDLTADLARVLGIGGAWCAEPRSSFDSVLCAKIAEALRNGADLQRSMRRGPGKMAATRASKLARALLSRVPLEGDDELDRREKLAALRDREDGELARELELESAQTSRAGAAGVALSAVVGPAPAREAQLQPPGQQAAAVPGRRESQQPRKARAAPPEVPPEAPPASRARRPAPEDGRFQDGALLRQGPKIGKGAKKRRQKALRKEAQRPPEEPPVPEGAWDGPDPWGEMKEPLPEEVLEAARQLAAELEAPDETRVEADPREGALPEGARQPRKGPWEEADPWGQLGQAPSEEARRPREQARAPEEGWHGTDPWGELRQALPEEARRRAEEPRAPGGPWAEADPWQELKGAPPGQAQRLPEGPQAAQGPWAEADPWQGLRDRAEQAAGGGGGAWEQHEASVAEDVSLAWGLLDLQERVEQALGGGDDEAWEESADFDALEGALAAEEPSPEPSGELEAAPRPAAAGPPAREPLPIEARRADIMARIGAQRVTVVAGATGCGKSTMVPQFLLEEPASRVLVTQPRRVAAIGIARHVASQRGERLGQGVGYRIGGESVGANCRLQLATVGYALAWFLARPEAFQGFTHIVLDEVHEQSADMEMFLLLTKLLMHFFPRTKIVLMSATLQADVFGNFFSEFLDASSAAPIAVEGRTFPVRQLFLDDIVDEAGEWHQLLPAAQAVRAREAVKEFDAACEGQGWLAKSPHIAPGLGRLALSLVPLLARSGGTLVVFLPGLVELEDMADLFSSLEARAPDPGGGGSSAPSTTKFS